MILLPAIDLYDGCAVRLTRGDYRQMQIYSRDPAAVAAEFAAKGASWLHVVDLAGARDGSASGRETVRAILRATSLRVEVGGGIRDEKTVRDYLDLGASRVILGTAAVTDPEFTSEMASVYGERIAVGVDVRDGFAAIRGWTETSGLTCRELFRRLSLCGIKTVICTDISRDGCLSGTNSALYRRLADEFSLNLIASGGISTVEDIRTLCSMNLYGAILGKALYTGMLDLADAIRVCEELSLPASESRREGSAP